MKKPERIGPYTLLRRLSPRQNGCVWLAAAGTGEHKLALKIARADDEAGRRRIMHEVDIAAAFDHPNIVRIHECGASRGITWITMAYLAGPHRALTLANFRQLLLALVHVHANEVIHAGIGPAGLLLDEAGDLRLADFAHARRAGQAGSFATGMLQFMSPEQLRGEPLDARADIFSAGVVLYEVLTGSRPFQATSLDKMEQIAQQSQTAPSTVAPGLGNSFDEVIERALARQRAGRYASAFEFLAAFDEACRRGVKPAAA